MSGRCRREGIPDTLGACPSCGEPKPYFPIDSTFNASHDLIEVCQDAAFLLAAGILGAGASWTPGASFWNAFGNSEYFLRCIDISGSEPEELIIYRFRRISHPALPEEPRVSSLTGA